MPLQPPAGFHASAPARRRSRLAGVPARRQQSCVVRSVCHPRSMHSSAPSLKPTEHPLITSLPCLRTLGPKPELMNENLGLVKVREFVPARAPRDYCSAPAVTSARLCAQRALPHTGEPSTHYSQPPKLHHGETHFPSCGPGGRFVPLHRFGYVRRSAATATRCDRQHSGGHGAPSSRSLCPHACGGSPHLISPSCRPAPPP